MLSKMAQPNNASGGGGTGGGVVASGSGRRLPLSLNAGAAVSRSQQGGGSPQNGGKKTEAFGAGPYVSLKKSSGQRSGSASSPSASASSGFTAKEDEKKSINGVSKSTNGKDKTPQNGNSAKDQKPKEKVEKVAEKRDNKDDQESTNVTSEKEAKKAVATSPIVKEKIAEIDLTVAEPDVVVVKDSPVKVPTTPTGERKSLRKAAASQQKSPTSKQSSSPATKKQTETEAAAPEPVQESPATPQEDVEMEPLTMDASPIRSVTSAVDHLNAQPAATSTPGRRLFGFGGSSKPPSNEVNLVAAQSSSPAPARTFAQISGRRSIRNTASLTPSKVGSYRCTTNDLDTSTSTNYSMNATVGSEIPNSSSFSFSFFGRGRKRERTPPQQLLGSKSTTDLPQDMETSPPKRARFDLFSLSLASPFSLLRSRFSKTTISSPQRLRLDQPTADGDENGKVQDVQCIAVEMDQQQLNISSGSAEEQDQKEVTVGQEAGLETPKKAGSPVKEINDKEINDGNAEADGENISPVAEEPVEVSEVENRSRCSIM
ncbi:polycystic kidney disease protein 1-like 3 [Drosophila obscura]|uniref:polycystic kidney disease protein 1-like 3 n=1 Tax=Drosophila obscura TaxID=7282 RepID=UPI001BB27A00|nr:polycystic kidney disease protein 1-like 3 [Drosophila obscura]XP_022212684.2 polycystic kidney disease protein 1-like 3 [Drosophila obscura]